jgi:hypothetical protein
MTVDLLQKAEANGSAQSHPIRANQLEVIPPGALIDDAVTQVDVLVEDQPQRRHAAREPPCEAFCTSRIDVAEVDEHAHIAGCGNVISTDWPRQASTILRAFRGQGCFGSRCAILSLV